jgi:hypothetical protein
VSGEQTVVSQRHFRDGTAPQTFFWDKRKAKLAAFLRVEPARILAHNLHHVFAVRAGLARD